MDTSKLKTFAQAARRVLREQVEAKLKQVLDPASSARRESPAAVERLEAHVKESGRESVIDAVAYTWFNRFCALRYMDARGYTRVRIVSPSEGFTQPEILAEAKSGQFDDQLTPETVQARVLALLNGTAPSTNPQSEAYRILLVAACNSYRKILPSIFEHIADEIELLMPDDLLAAGSVLSSTVETLTEDDCKDVEILGWLYQFYISERKDQVMARKSAVPTEDIPAVTQLFTPHWIVRYLVENSLGRLWLLNRPGSRLREHMPYYIEEVASDQWPVTSGEKAEVASGQNQSYANQNLQRPDRVAESHGPRGTNLQANQELSEGRTLRPDQPAAAGGGVRALEHRGGASTPIDSGIQELPFDSTGIIGGSGDADSAGHPLRISESASGHPGTQSARGNLQNALQSPKQTGHWPLITDHLRISSPEEIRLCDPAVGSAHMLTYAFDLLFLIYEEEGYAPTEIPALILRHNLHGLEICPRAAQLAELALVFKAREKSRRFFQPEHLVRPRIIELRDLRFAENELRDYIQALGLGALFSQPLLTLLHQFEEAKNFGSLIQPCLDERAIADVRRAIEAKDLGGQLFLRETHLKVLRVLEQAEALTQRYHVVVANPPYMGSGAFNAPLKAFVDDSFKAGNADLYGCFIERIPMLLLKDGLYGMITIPSWMFLVSFEALRRLVLSNLSIRTYLYLGRGVWGSDFGSCAFVLKNSADQSQRGAFKRLFNKPGEVNSNEVLHDNFFSKPVYRVTSKELSEVPGTPLAFWLSPKQRNAFANSKTLESIARPKHGMSTGNNGRFLRGWHEVGSSSFYPDAPNRDSAKASGKKWFPYNKGGDYRKWYGNRCLVINFGADGRDLKAGIRDGTNSGCRLLNQEFFFKECITWADVTARETSFRFSPPGSVFDGRGSSAFPAQDLIPVVLGLLNSNTCAALLSSLNPGFTTTIGDLNRIPIIQNAEFDARVVSNCIDLAKADWDNFETSWDFRDQPLLRPGLKGATLDASWRNWEAQSTATIRRMQELETENNRLFIAAYGLEGELQPEVPEAQITLFCNPASRYKKKPKKKKKEDGEEISTADDSIEGSGEELSYSLEERSRFFRADTVGEFLSYAVGCMMGRYSPDHPGLILANSGDTLREFLEKVGKPLAELTFAPDEDCIIPVLDGEWFEDDIVARTRDFLRATFGEATLRENLRFLEDSLGKDLRKYFLTDFYKDHLQTYKKRPIYWLFSSGKQRAFQCLVYLHRYTEGTLARMRTEYVIPLQGRMASRIEQLETDKAKATSTSHGKSRQKEQDDLKKQQAELLTFEEKLKHAADQKIRLDLDDGVKVNYGKFGDLLAEVKAVCGSKEEE